MDNDTVIFLWFMAIAVSYAILTWIISVATQTRKKIKYEENKIRLLMLIAKKLEVSQEEINEAIR